MRIRRALSVLLALGVLLFSGCTAGDDLTEVRIAYRAASMNGESAIAYQTRRVNASDGERLCSLVLQLAMTEPEDEELTSAIPKRTAVRSVEITEDGVVAVDLSEEYAALEGIGRTLADACVTLTLCALGTVRGTAVRGVTITVEGEGDGAVLTPDDLVWRSDRLRLRDHSFRVWFPNRSGERLESDLFIRTLSDEDQPAEAIVSILMDGRRSNGSVSRVVSEDTVLYWLTIRSRVCTLNFNEHFLDGEPWENAGDLVVYAFVNSLCELSYIDRVQFLIEGEAIRSPRIDSFDQPFSPT